MGKFLTVEYLGLDHNLYYKFICWQTFQWQKVLLKSSELYTDYESYEPSSSTPYSRPEKGTSMEQFRDMVMTYVESKLGEPGDHKQLVDRIMDVADINKDAKVGGNSVHSQGWLWPFKKSCSKPNFVVKNKYNL